MYVRARVRAPAREVVGGETDEDRGGARSSEERDAERAEEMEAKGR